VKVALAGFEPAEIAVTATPSEVIVKASHHRKSSEGTDTKVRWSELSSNDVYRRVPLPGAVDVEKVTATFKNGLLEIVAPLAKAAPAASAKIPVTSKRVSMARGGRRGRRASSPRTCGQQDYVGVETASRRDRAP
jgi:HSP20 family protein